MIGMMFAAVERGMKSMVAGMKYMVAGMRFTVAEIKHMVVGRITRDPKKNE